MILVTRGTPRGGESGAEGVLTPKGVSRARVVERLGETVGVWGLSAGGGWGYGSSLGARTPQNGRRRARRGSGSGNSSTWRAGRRHAGGERICWARLADTSRSGHVRPPSRGPCGQWPRHDRSPAARPPSGTAPKTPGMPDGPRSCWDVGAGEPQDRPRAGKARHVETRRPREAKALCHGCTFPGQRRVSLGVRTTQHLGRTKDLSEGSHVHTRQPTCQKSATRETTRHACKLELSQTGCHLSSCPGTSARCWG